MSQRYVKYKIRSEQCKIILALSNWLFHSTKHKKLCLSQEQNYSFVHPLKLACFKSGVPNPRSASHWEPGHASGRRIHKAAFVQVAHAHAKSSPPPSQLSIHRARKVSDCCSKSMFHNFTNFKMCRLPAMGQGEAATKKAETPGPWQLSKHWWPT